MRTLANGAQAFDVRWTDRRKVRQAHTCYDIDEATEFLADRRRELRRGGAGNPTGGRITLRDWNRLWWATREIRGTTGETESIYIKNHTLSYFGEFRLVDIRKQDIAKWMIWLREEKRLSNAVIARLRRLLSQCLQAAVEDERLAANQVALTKPPRIVRQDRRFLLPDEAATVEAVFDPWWRLTVPFLADTGLRVGELAAVRVSDIKIVIAVADDLTRMVPIHMAMGARIMGASVRVPRGAVEVSKKFSGKDTRRYYEEPKTEAGRRTVPTITASVARRIVDQVIERSLTADDLLFTGRHGAPMSPHNWRERCWATAIKRAGLADPQPTPHAMRHTAVSYWIAAGTVEPLKLAMWAGHSGTRMIYELYGHLLPEDANEMREALEAIRDAAVATKVKEANVTELKPKAHGGMPE